MGISSKHLNGNLLCAMDIETSGLEPGFHEVLQLAIVPLQPNYTPATKEYRLFHMKFRPCHPERAPEDKINRSLLLDCCNNGIDYDTGIDRLREWFQNLHLPFRKSIIPLGHNFNAFDRPHLIRMLGGLVSYDEFFRSDARDSATAALFLNDLADWHSEAVPFAKWSLGALCNRLNVTNANPHDAVSDCLATAECYRRLMSYKGFCAGTMP